MNFGQNLKSLRKSKQISQEELAEKVKVSRQSVSKWETGEAYPEMNNILQLCKIFHCHINDLVNDNILDIDSLDEDVKMSAVKLKKEKQKQIKTISKILSLIGKIGGIVARVAIPFVVIIMIMIPMIFKNIDVKDGVLISTNDKVEIIQNVNSIDINYGNSKFISNIQNNDVSRFANVLENYSKTTVIMIFEIGFVFLIAFLILLIKLLKHLELLFDNINKGDTPFTLDNVRHIKVMTYLIIACIIVSGIGESVLNMSVNEDVSFGFEAFDIVEILFLYSMSLIFEYGHEIQLDSKGRIYGGDNE